MLSHLQSELRMLGMTADGCQYKAAPGAVGLLGSLQQHASILSLLNMVAGCLRCHCTQQQQSCNRTGASHLADERRKLGSAKVNDCTGEKL
jgi:hypothetical protein